MKHPGGRPVKFKTVEELQIVIDEYFDWCDNATIKLWDDKKQSELLGAHPAPYTMSGLARRIGIDRDTLLNYSKKEEFFGTVKAARDRVHEDVETRLMDGRNQAGAIFNLKNNFGWKDQTQTDITSMGEKLAPMVTIDTKHD